MRDTHFPGRSVVMSTRGMASTSHPLATSVALDVLRDGGNAMDAAVAACATLCVTEPQSTGIGGDCFLLYYEAKSGELFGLNGSGRAPAGATLAAYREREYQEMPAIGIHAATVPGAIDAWECALGRFGTRTLADSLRPAIDFATEGYPVTPVIAGVWKSCEELLSHYECSSRALLVDGKAPLAGSLHRQPDLARSLELIAADGSDALYRGPIAEEIVRFSESHDGFFTLEDFAEHSSTWVTPISSTYRGHRLYELPPNGQGITALMMLNILEHTDIGSLDPVGAERVHLFAEAYKLAMAERDQFVSDPEFNDLPIEDLLCDEFSARQWDRIDLNHALPSQVGTGFPQARDTVYLSVVDAERNMVSFINSTCYSFGCGMVAGNTGVVLQNRGVCFSLEEGHRNCVAPGKRSMHTIIPAMLYSDDRPSLCFGVMGGHYQPMGHSYVLSNWIDHGMDLQEALDAPRFQPEGERLGVERGIPAETRAGLTERGHQLLDSDKPYGGGQCIYVDWEQGILQAGSEPRKDGCALGY